MRARLLLSLMLVAGVSGSAEPAFRHQVKDFNARLDLSLQMLSAVADPMGQQAADFRGRHKIDDLKQWAFTDETLGRLAELRKTANSGDAVSPHEALAQGSALLEASIARAQQIGKYWRSTPAPFWRTRWDAFAAANGLPAAAANERVAPLEKRLGAALDAGDFERAANEVAPELIAALNGAVASATDEIARNAKSDALEFRPRLTPCPAPGAHSRIAEDFYPPSSLRREEEGDIVLRAKIDRAGCATQVALVVKSGYPDLDAAALRSFEVTEFKPKMVDGNPADSEVTFKVRFHLKP